jgi:hypothetical protein
MATCFLLKSRECCRVIGVAGILLSLGLGLAISRSIVEDHGGRLSAENRADSALFRIALPTYVEGEPAPGPIASPEAASARRRLPDATLPRGSS